ncbi:helix-turn-helix domain-containing protein [Paenibacillus sp. J5C_2022]|uniref:response regulator transcription factor n=1 Tax=Paenibacillus sp. J5C2022 TaxID=2977129 RepID=UPI0021D1BD95|nr:helix-turn-helix domain-containing protein [Paenibacillus sp. J5C2022]MCU6709697.1 helix-turn-helix domain-containing protein [Paenibacillus sp. J5C2022]
MYSLLIVDDEIYAVNGLKDGLDWSVMGFTAVYEAYDSTMARDRIESTPIDVMICDIEMPGSSGLELLEWVNDQGYSMETIFLTCHSKFAYAQKALQLGSLNYLVKPVNFIELESIIMRALRNRVQEQEASFVQKEYHKYLQLWEARKPLMLERFWQDLLDYRNEPSEGWIDRELAGYETNLSKESRVFPVLVSIERWHKEIDTRDEAIMEYALRCAAKEIMLKDGAGIVFEDREGMMVILAYGGGKRTIQEWKTICGAFVEACQLYFYSTVICYLGKETDIRHLRSMYRALQYEVQNNVRRASQIVCHIEDSSARTETSVALPDFYEWAEWLETEDPGLLIGRMYDYFEQLEKEAGVKAESLQRFYDGLLQMLHYLLHKNRAAAPQLQGGRLPDKDAATLSISALRVWAEMAVSIYAEAIQFELEAESPIDKAKRYINERLKEEISREQIADYVYLNPGYLSRLFKKETGESLSDYILRKRMALAKRELTHSDEPISKVARSLGYNSLSYFGKSFKRFYGMNPQDFRNGAAEQGRLES